VYPDPEVAAAVEEHFVPARIHIKEQKDTFKRFGAEWTPTILTWDADSNAERHRIEGFLPKEEFLAQLALGRGHFAFGREMWDEAERAFREAAARTGTDGAAEGAYWAGVSKYKRSGDAAALRETGQILRDKYPQSVWAKKGSVWL
jgi:thioredoxin family protein